MTATSRKRETGNEDIRHVSTRIVEYDANKTDRTVRRDLKELEQFGLIERLKSPCTSACR
jgi:predicted transcriptional regulator